MVAQQSEDFTNRGKLVMNESGSREIDSQSLNVTRHVDNTRSIESGSVYAVSE